MYSERLNKTVEFLSEEDKQDIKQAFSLWVDWLALSFVRNKEDILKVKELALNTTTKIMSKIETKEAINNYEEILKASEGIMIARGDLGVIEPYNLGRIQDLLVTKTLKTTKKLVVGTGFLRTLKTNLFPTRAETIDLYEVFKKGVKTIMFSGETAISKNPLLVLETANKIYESINKEDLTMLEE